MSSLKSQSPLKHPQTHTVLPFPLCPVWGTISQAKKSESMAQVAPRFLIIRAQLADRPRLPAPLAVSPPRSPVFNPNPCDTFSWPTSKSPFTPFLPAASLLLPKPRSKREHPKAVWSPLSMAAASRFKSQHQSPSAAPFPTPPTFGYICQHSHILPAFLGCHSKSGQVWPRGVL